MSYQAMHKQYLLQYSKRLMIGREDVTDLMTFYLSDRSLLRVPEHLPTPVVTEEVVLTH